MLVGWKTLIFNGLISVLSVAALVVAYLDAAHVETFLPPEYAWVTLLVGSVNIVLRVMTTTPIFQRKAPE